ncbi:MAG: DUF502 domain-containing protein [Deltaproteobacteria bacterium]|nr:DUF502 domain-containing protein [Deltaproteobacteria bacterium]MBN2688261.1 DUF502 domain-containing protein [Deltaproteobacteria bacterium]
MKKAIKNIFLTGIIAIIPVGLTSYIIYLMIRMMDNLLKVIPPRYHPDQLLPFHIPGLGVIFTLILIFIVGLIVKSYIGKKAVDLGEWILGKIPFVSGIYIALKKLAETIFSDKSQSFRRVVLIEYPRKGLYSVAFVTGLSKGEVQAKTEDVMLNLFVPTTPNPTSGFYIMIPESEVINLTMTVEEAFTLIMSGGIVTPSDNKHKQKKQK